ncbi:MAG: hypothetical protein ACI8PZ_005414 [Myxococcota bacterium]|jgi:hypothetical protein
MSSRLGLLMSLLSVACGPPYERTLVGLITHPPEPVEATVDGRNLTFHQGTASLVQIAVLDTEGARMEATVRSADGSVARVYRASETDDWVVAAARVGKTDLRVVVRGEVVARVSVTVRAQD